MSVAALALLALTLDLGEALDVLRAASPRPLMLVLGVVALQVLVRAARWRLLLPRRPDGLRPALGATVSALLVGYLASGVLPARLGEPIRALVVARSQRLSVGGALGAVILERVIDLAVLAVIGLAAAAAIGAPAWIVNLALFVALLAVSLLVFLLTVGLDPILAAARWLAERSPWRLRPVAGSAVRRVGTFADGVSGHRRRPDVAFAAILSAVGWVLDAVIVGLVGAALGLSLGPGEAMVISAVGALATAIPSAPGYLGTFEVAVTAAAVAVGASGAEGLALAITTHAIVLGPVLAAGVVALARTGATLGSLAGEAVAESALDRPAPA